MKRHLLMLLVLLSVVPFAGCTQKPEAANADQAIELSKAKGDVQAQAQYLISQANAFVSSQQFDEAIKSAKYVLANLDKNSQEAQSIIEKATAELKKMAEQKAGELKDKLGGLGQ